MFELILLTKSLNGFYMNGILAESLWKLSGNCWKNHLKSYTTVFFSEKTKFNLSGIAKFMTGSLTIRPGTNVKTLL